PETKKLWFSGPEWLQHDEELLGQKVARENAALSRKTDIAVSDPERKPKVSTCLSAVRDRTVSKDNIFFENTFSSWRKCVRFWSLMLRLKEKARFARQRGLNKEKAAPTPARRKFNEIDASEMISAKSSLIQLVQKTHFAEEYENRCTNVKKTSVLYQYTPFSDSEGFIRCRTRLERSRDLTEDEKYPILLPADSNLSSLIVKDIHENRCFHSGGVSAILHALREDFLL
ncbi:uncharacterized protein LOC108864996, partial [Galendromus occidentalis]|uniref:Uncharacterized protein LOC108864996 n=1 Tax=Galendromus occidentalis TaxID=34638 RepID=A0AAJ7L7T0_9ACAR